METIISIRTIKQKILFFFEKIKFQYKFWLFYAWLSFVSLIVLPLFIIRGKNVTNSIFLTEITKHVSKIIGVKWCLRNQNIIAEERGAVIVANHQSSLDILGMTNLWYVLNKCAMVSKIDLLYSPIGPALYLMGAIFLNRKLGRESQIKLKTQADYYLKNKTKIWIYPEGTRNKDTMKMLPFKKGAFITAISSQVPIIPLVFSPYYFINKKEKKFCKGRIIVQCLDPIPTEGLTLDDLPELIERVKSLMERTYQDLLSEVTRDLPENYPLVK